MTSAKKILVISNGNDEQIPFLIRLFQSLYSSRKGAFSGDFMFFSDHILPSSQERLQKEKIPYTLLNKQTVLDWEKQLHSQKHALGKIAKPKFIYHAIQTLGNRYDYLVYIDPDILLQRPLSDVIAPLGELKTGVFYSAQSNPTNKIRWPKMQLERAFHNHHLKPEDLNGFEPEINTGFLFGDIASIASFMEDLLAFMTAEPFNVYANADPDSPVANDWHDQDFFRLYARIEENDNNFSIIPSPYIYHLCNDVYQEFKLSGLSTTLKKKATGEIPHLVHFAGGVWINFLRLSLYYYGLHGFVHWLERITHRPRRLLRNKLIETYHQFRRWWIPNYRKIKKVFKK